MDIKHKLKTSWGFRILFFIIALFAIGLWYVTIPILIIRAIYKNTKLKPLFKHVASICIAVFFFIVAVSLWSSNSRKNATSSQISNSPTQQIDQATKEPESPQASIESKIRDSVKKQTNLKKDKIIEIRVNKAFDNENEYVVFVSINADDNLSEDLIKKGLWGDMGSIYIALYKDPSDIREATVVTHFPMSDKYGNSSDQVVLKTSLDSVEAKKVNWSLDKATLSLQILPEVWKTQVNLFK